MQQLRFRYRADMLRTKFAEKHLGLFTGLEGNNVSDDPNRAPDIEADIGSELDSLKTPSHMGLFQAVKMDIQCGTLANGVYW